MTELVLYGHPDSGHACKVALALSVANVPYRTVWVDIWADPSTRPAEFRAASPFAEVPLLQIDGRPFVQSGAILLEIATRFRCLGAETPDGLRLGRELLMWEANRIGMCLPQLKEARRVNRAGFPPARLTGLHQRFKADSQRFGVLLGKGPSSMAKPPALAIVRSGAIANG